MADETFHANRLFESRRHDLIHLLLDFGWWDDDLEAGEVLSTYNKKLALRLFSMGWNPCRENQLAESLNWTRNYAPIAGIVKELVKLDPERIRPQLDMALAGEIRDRNLSKARSLLHMGARKKWKAVEIEQQGFRRGHPLWEAIHTGRAKFWNLFELDYSDVDPVYLLKFALSEGNDEVFDSMVAGFRRYGQLDDMTDQAVRFEVERALAD
ncbi:hypothetical protein [Pelagicoccus sp. SDUM812003]|uniref:hypothetical protein n=1 Tax=Pelagicoccus sp. SDUM812003 TaxID=3041267 RepID=UPI00280DB7CD|nr:hypothetical protein [Pelagicoccus sp. SDUM812003]MDQ8202790.1 hypothetical protein [Pelagicoccus sp. SDUM812003]